MILGIRNIPKVPEESYCKNSEDDYFSEIGDYKIHSPTLMPMIEFEEAAELDEEVDDTIFVNGEDCKLSVKNTVTIQNYLTTRYVGKAPLKFYGKPTKMGEQFILICRNNNPSYLTRYFGTVDAIRGFNRNSNDAHYLPKGN